MGNIAESDSTDPKINKLGRTTSFSAFSVTRTHPIRPKGSPIYQSAQKRIPTQHYDETHYSQ
jgi:hypothetical protein